MARCAPSTTPAPWRTQTVVEHRVLRSPWQFRRYGQTGRWVSDLFPQIGQHVDDLCFVQAMHTNGIAHGPATLFLHTGSINLVRPSVGSWVLYGLGTENQNLPGFVTICPSMGNGGPRNWNNAFLPSVYQGTPLGRAGLPATEARIRNATNAAMTPAQQRRQLDLLQSLNAEQLARTPGDTELEAVIGSFDLAHRMQMHAPGILDLSAETRQTQQLYGIGAPATDNFGRQCLTCGPAVGGGGGALHSGDLRRQHRQSRVGSALQLADARHPCAGGGQAGGGVAGRPEAAWAAGGYSCLVRRRIWPDPLCGAKRHGPRPQPEWFHRLAGRRRRPSQGFTFGATDEFDHHAIENKVHMHDTKACDAAALAWVGSPAALTFNYALAATSA